MSFVFWLLLFYVLLEYIVSISMGLNREKDAQKDTRDSNIAMNVKESLLLHLTKSIISL